MTIKKSYQDIVSLLEANANKKVSTMLPEVLELAKASRKAKTSYADENGNIIAIFCYYHKQWELVEDVEFGKKASSSTGFNTMCKIGVKHWTKQNNAIKNVGAKVLDMLENGEIEPNQVTETKEKLIEDAKEIQSEDKPIGFETIEELEEYLNK